MSFDAYLRRLKEPYRRLIRLDFLNPDGSPAFSIGNAEQDPRGRALIAGGELTCALNNGRRRQALILLDNAGGDYEFAVNRLWFGQQIRLSEGLRLADGTDWLIPQGVFYPEDPEELLGPRGRTVRLRLADKWSLLEEGPGTLEGDYLVPAGSHIFEAMAALLRLSRFTGQPVDPADPAAAREMLDPLAPVFTTRFRDRVQHLPDGSEVPLLLAPHDCLIPAGSSLAQVLLQLAELLPARVGYDACGRLRVDPSEDDADPNQRPVLWSFRPDDGFLLQLRSTLRSGSVYNDCVVVGGSSGDSPAPRARVRNLDPASPTCVNRIGLRTLRCERTDYSSEEACLAYAEWKLKRAALPVRSLELSCRPLYHLSENGILTLSGQLPGQTGPEQAEDRYILQSFTRPLADEPMTLTAVSAEAFPTLTRVE